MPRDITKTPPPAQSPAQKILHLLPCGHSKRRSYSPPSSCRTAAGGSRRQTAAPCQTPHLAPQAAPSCHIDFRRSRREEFPRAKVQVDAYTAASVSCQACQLPFLYKIYHTRPPQDETHSPYSSLLFILPIPLVLPRAPSQSPDPYRNTDTSPACRREPARSPLRQAPHTAHKASDCAHH